MKLMNSWLRIDRAGFTTYLNTVRVLKNSRWFSSEGFTLIELLVTISIVAGTSVLALVNMNQVGSRQEVIKTVKEVQLALAETKNLALAPEVGKDVQTNSYTLHRFSSPGQANFEIRESIIGGGGGTLPPPLISPSPLPPPGGIPPPVVGLPPPGSAGFPQLSRFVRTIELPSGITVTEPTGQNMPAITFSITNQGRIVWPRPTNGVVTYFFTRGTQTIELRISTLTGQSEII